MQQRGIEFRELIALETANDVSRRRAGVERAEFCRDHVQTIQRRAVNMLVMTFDQTRRDTVQGPGAAEQRGDLVLHRDRLLELSGCDGDWKDAPRYSTSIPLAFMVAVA